ncbi:MAG: Fe-S cluster assembly ATPase SufC [Candidatus Aenigmarchaeota archaeon]|nr:Fe-S cluster assembly ATPase SufC [Candidatus Aenigmarchaeota archaeon]
MVSVLQVKELRASIEGKEILKGLNLTIRQGELHAIMGPNGSGKSTLANVIMGHPKYKITSGDIILDGKSILNETTDQRAKQGLFMAFQHPMEVSGVPLSNFLRTAYKAAKNQTEEKDKQKELSSVSEFRKTLKEKMEMLKVDESFGRRYLNEGLSGGEKKKSEILQALILQPKFAILDETDSGTDIDAMKIISQGINNIYEQSKSGILIITHYNRILHNVKPQFVHILVNGKIVKTSDYTLADQVETTGYNEFLEGAVKNA